MAPTLLPVFTRLGTRWLGLLRLALVLVPIAVAVTLAMRAESVDFSLVHQNGYALPASPISTPGN